MSYKSLLRLVLTFSLVGLIFSCSDYEGSLDRVNEQLSAYEYESTYSVGSSVDFLTDRIRDDMNSLQSAAEGGELDDTQLAKFKNLISRIDAIRGIRRQ